MFLQRVLTYSQKLRNNPINVICVFLCFLFSSFTREN
nr:CPPV004 hypothetical protein [Cooks petrelpox virus]WCB87166.1 CPPV355 hypothetical protein [Cooks petrelpox virus]